MEPQRKEGRRGGSLWSAHPVVSNLIVIVAVALLGIWIAYLAAAIFTKHGESDVVPGVENMSYTQAIGILHDNGFKVDIRDSIYNDRVRPGYVIEQFPKANSVVKPGRKIFLYINAVHPKEVVIDEDPDPREDALRSFSFRQGMARLEELGFKNIQVLRVLGDNDCIIKVTANGRTVKKTERVPVNARIVVEVSDGRLGELRDSLQNAEYLEYRRQAARAADPDSYDSDTDYGYAPDQAAQPVPQPDDTDTETTDYLNQ